MLLSIEINFLQQLKQMLKADDDESENSLRFSGRHFILRPIRHDNYSDYGDYYDYEDYDGYSRKMIYPSFSM